MNRSVLTRFAVLPLALLLAACGGDDDETPEAPVAEAAAPATPVAVEPAPPAAEPAAPIAEPAAPATPVPQAIEPAPEPAAPAAQAELPAPGQQVAEAPLALAPLPADQPATPDAEGNYVGIAEAVEGDVLRMGRTRFLLWGIDTMEAGQTCRIGNEQWDCWAAGLRQLQTYIAEGPTTCTPVGAPDIFGRILAECFVNGESINERMVRTGFAVVFADEMPEYVPLMEAARADMVGIWQGSFVAPADYRAERNLTLRRP